MKKKITIYFFIGLFICHSAYAQCTHCGSYTSKVKIFDSTLNDYRPVSHNRDLRVLYKDSFAIVPSIIIYSTQKNGVETEWHSADKYLTFIDLHIKPHLNNVPFSGDSLHTNKFTGVTFYEYPALSKDSFFTKKYYNLDTALARVGWNFFLEKVVKKNDSIPTVPDDLISLADTVLDGAAFKRYKLVQMANKSGTFFKSIQIAYCSCTIENWMLFFLPVDSTTGCLFTRIDWTLIGLQPWYSQQYEFSSGLTKNELEVFAAWEKNAKENPVTKEEKNQ